MATLIATKRMTVTTSASPLALDSVCETKTPGARYLTVNGARAFDLGNFCETCSFLFERLEGAPQESVGEASTHPAADELDRALRAGMRQLDESTVDAASLLIPAGAYEVCLLEITPRLVRPFSDGDYFTHEQVELWGSRAWAYWTGLPHFTHAEYYRTTDLALGLERELFEFVVPLVPPARADTETVTSYRERLEDGARPTALALSILDVKQPAVWDGDPKITVHWCLTHYLVDGHHKMLAAAEANRPITLLSFVSRDEGASLPSDVDTALGFMANARSGA